MFSNCLAHLQLLICLLVSTSVSAERTKLAIIAVHGSPLAALEGMGVEGKGGMCIYVWELARHLAELDYNVTTFTRSESVNQTGTVFLSDNNRVTHIAAGPQTFLNKQLLYHHVDEFATKIDTFQFDLVISNYWISALVGLKLGLPQIHVHHSHAADKYAWEPVPLVGNVRIEAERKVNAEADCVIHQYSGEYHLTNAANYRVITPGITSDIFYGLADKEASLRNLNFSTNVINVLYAGRFEPQKGISFALEALNKTTHQVAVRLIGGYKNQPLEYLVDMYPNFQFLGPLPHRDVLEHMTASDIFIMPSLYEAFGLAAVEALASGCCVLCSSIGGINETVVEGLNGFKFPPKDPNAILEAFEKLVGDPELMREMSKRNRETGRRNYSWRKTAEQFDHAIKDVTARRALKTGHTFPSKSEL